MVILPIIVVLAWLTLSVFEKLIEQNKEWKVVVKFMKSSLSFYATVYWQVVKSDLDKLSFYNNMWKIRSWMQENAFMMHLDSVTKFEISVEILGCVHSVDTLKFLSIGTPINHEFSIWYKWKMNDF